MKKVLSYVVDETHPSKILLELIENESEICFMFGLYGCLGLLYKNARIIEPMTDLCKAYEISNTNSIIPFIPKEECDKLGISIQFARTISVSEIRKLNDILISKNQERSKFMLVFNFKNDINGHAITLRIEGDDVVRYCSSNQAIKESIRKQKHDPGLKCSKPNIISNLNHFIRSQEVLHPETIDIYEIKELFKKNKKLKTNYI